MPPDVQDLDVGDEPYDSAEDEDFQLDDAGDESEVSSASEGEGTTAPARKKRKADTGDQDAAELDSGDEATIQKAKKKRRKAKKSKAKGADVDDDEVDFDEEGGPGGFVRTRAMRSRMYVYEFLLWARS